MRHKKLTLSIIILLVLGLTSSNAQQAISAAGGNASGSGGKVSYSIGQLFYSYNTSPDYSVAQGVQQPWEISIITEIAEAESINLKYSVYPNPVSDNLILEIDDFDNEKLEYILFDINGKLLKNDKIKDRNTIISLQDLSNSI